MSKLLLLFLISTLLINKLSAQYFKPYVENFTQNHYGDSCHTQNWSITQNNFQEILIGNNIRVLNYDGESWGSTRVSEFGGFTTSLYYSARQNRTFVGANGEFGEIILDSLGRKKYQSLSNKLTDEDSFFSNIWKIFEIENSIVFFCEERIFLLENDKLKVISPQTSFHLAFKVNGKLLLRQRDIGLMKLGKKNLELINDQVLFKQFGIFGIFETRNNQKIVITQELGAFLFKSKEINSELIAIENKFKQELIEAKIVGCTILSDGNIALSTIKKGVLIINEKAEIINRINKDIGLLDNDVKQVFQDQNNDLWLALNAGISRVNYSSPVSKFDYLSNLTGDITSLILNKGQLIAGTSNGLFYYNPTTKSFNLDPNFNTSIYQISNIGELLIISTDLGVFEYNGKNKIKITNLSMPKFHYSKKNKVLFVVEKNNIEQYYYANLNWKLVNQINSTHLGNITTIVEGIGKKDKIDYWIGTLNNGVFRIIEKNKKLSYEQYTLEDGLSSGATFPLRNDTSVFFGTRGGLLQFSEKITLNENSYKGFFEPSNYLNLSTDAITFLKMTPFHIFLIKNGQPIIYNKEQKEYDTLVFNSLNIGKINTMLISNNNVFIAGNQGLNYIDIERPFNKLINVTISKVLVNNQVIHYGNKQPKKQYKINYNNSITVQFASLNIENGIKVKYSYLLEGYDDKWSNWEDDNSATYKKMPIGSYHFKVKSKNKHNIVSQTKVFSFEVPPPFYLTSWAYIFYALFLLFIFYILLKIYTYKLKNDKIKLESTIEERTKEIVTQKKVVEKQRDFAEEQKKEIAIQHVELEEVHKEITDSINYAKRLQDAILPSFSEIGLSIKEYFIHFQPKDVVSGDFYWFEHKIVNDQPLSFIAAADCTGHGVPGAMVSVVCSNALYRTVNEFEITEPAEILDKTRELVIETFTKSGGIVKDGMDIALCAFSKKQVIFSGANNPLWIVRDTEKLSPSQKELRSTYINNDLSLIEIKADRQPIGLYEGMKPFSQTNVELFENDMLYFFTDGFADQFGGEKGKKFKYKPFKKLLIEISSLDVDSQKKVINTTFNNWKGALEQIDDVCIIGVRHITT